MNTCIKLHDLGEIDEYLQITYNKVKKEGITVDDLTTKLSEITILEGKNCYYEKKVPVFGDFDIVKLLNIFYLITKTLPIVSIA